MQSHPLMNHCSISARVLSRNKFWGGGSLSITVNDCAQDMHIDLMHVLYVYSRVMIGGGGVLTKYSRGAGTCIMWYPRHL